MSFIKRALTTIALFAAFANCSAMGVGQIPGSEGSGGATAADVQQFTRDAQAADAVVRQAAFHLTLAVSNKEEADKLKAERAAILNIPDPKEREAKLSKFDSDNMTRLEQQDFDAASKRLEQEQDVKKKHRVKASIWNLGWGALTDASLLHTGKKIVSGVPSPDVAPHIGDVKTAMERIGSQAKSLKSIVSKSKALMAAVELKALPTSAAAKPMEIAD